VLACAAWQLAASAEPLQRVSLGSHNYPAAVADADAAGLHTCVAVAADAAAESHMVAAVAAGIAVVDADSHNEAFAEAAAAAEAVEGCHSTGLVVGCHNLVPSHTAAPHDGLFDRTPNQVRYTMGRPRHEFGGLGGLGPRTAEEPVLSRRRSGYRDAQHIVGRDQSCVTRSTCSGIPQGRLRSHTMPDRRPLVYQEDR